MVPQVKIYNPTDKDLVFPLNKIKFPSKKTVSVAATESVLILNTWGFLEVKGAEVVMEKGKVKEIRLGKEKKVATLGKVEKQPHVVAKKKK